MEIRKNPIASSSALNHWKKKAYLLEGHGGRFFVWVQPRAEEEEGG